MNPRKIIYFFLWLLVIGMPLLVNVYSDDEFTVNKTSFFRLVILVILGIFLYYFSQIFEIVRNLWKSYKPYLVFLIVYLSLFTLATIFSSSPFLSLFGAQRQQGWLQFFFYCFLFFIVLLIVKKKQIPSLILGMVVVSSLISIIGFLEYFNIRPVWFPVYDRGVASLLGHPSFLGAYLVMIIPITLALLIISKSYFKKAFLGLILLLQIVVLVFTETRAVWIALMLSFFMAVVLGLIKKRKTILLLTLSILFIILIIVVVFSSAFNQLLNFKEGSGALRILWWDQAAALIQQKPLLGYGFGIQEDLFMSNYHPLQGVYGLYSGRVDRVHNEILDQLLTTGILGTIFFFTFVILLFKEGIANFIKNKNKKEQIILLALLTGLFAYFIQGMFSFSLTALYVYFWLFVGLLLVLIRGGENLEVTVINQKSWSSKVIKGIIPLVGVPISLFFIWFIVFRPAIADVYLQKMTSINLKSRFTLYEIQDLHKTIISYASFTSGEIPYRYRYFNILLKLASWEEKEEVRIQLFQTAEEELEIIYKKNPVDFDFYPTLAELMRQWGKINQEKYKDMNVAFQKAVENSPLYPPFYYLWGRGLKEEGDYQEALRKFSQALVLFPSPDFSGTNPESKKYLSLARAEVYQELGETERLLGNSKLAESYLKKSQELRTSYLPSE